MSRIPRFSGLTGSHQVVNSKTEENITTLSSSSSQGTEVRPHLCVGDRVVVNGDKFGTLRFIGPTEFKPGEWCGIELDDTRGLNDGSVDGVRYFQCEFKRGLFVTSSKVQKLHPAFDSGSTVRRRRLSQSSAISQESESSFGCRSLTSSQRNHPPTRLGNTKLIMKNVAARSYSGQIPVHISLQRSLKEKDLLVEKLLIERDLERLEFSRAAEQVDHAEKQFSNLESQYRAILQLAEEQDAEIKRLQLVNEETLAKCEEQKLRSEDLEFQLEELRAASSEVIPSTIGDEEIKAKIIELNASVLTADLQAKKANEELKSEKDKNAKLSSHIESLENELKVLRSKANNRASMGKESMEKELDALKNLCEELEKTVSIKNEKIDELEQIVFELTENAEEQKSMDEQNQIANEIKEKERLSVFERLLQKLEQQAACLADYPSVLKRNADLVDEKNLLEKEYSQLSQACLKLSDENKLLKKTAENNTSNVKWDSVVNKYESEITSLKEYITTLEEEKLPALGQQLMDLMGDIHHKENEIIEQKKTIKNLETRIADFESQNRSDIRHNGVCQHYNHIGGTGMPDSRKMLEEQPGKPSNDTANEFYDAESDFKKSNLLRKVAELEEEIHLKDTCIAKSNAEHMSRIAELLSKIDQTDKEHSSLLSDIKRMEEENNRYREKLKTAESMNEKYKLVMEENEKLKVNLTRLNTIRKSEDELMDMFNQLERISKIREQEAENLRKELTNCKLELDAANKTINLFKSYDVVSKTEKDGKL